MLQSGIISEDPRAQKTMRHWVRFKVPAPIVLGDNYKLSLHFKNNDADYINSQTQGNLKDYFR